MPVEQPQRQTLFVQGVQKTGSSTLVAILNCLPEALLLYETGLARTLVSGYGSRLLEYVPEARRLFQNGIGFRDAYLELAEILESRFGIHYRWIGDKLIDLDPDRLKAVLGDPVIFTLRDIRSWLVKEQIVKWYRTDLDVIPVAIDYLNYVLGSYRHAAARRIWLETMIVDHSLVFRTLGDYLGIDLASAAARWWEMDAGRKPGDPKSFLGWEAVHPSTGHPPGESDTTVDLRPHPFWDAVIPIMDKYSGHAVLPPGVSASDLQEEQAGLIELNAFAPLRLDQLYKRIDTCRLGTPAGERPDPSSSSDRSRPRWKRWLGDRRKTRTD